MQRDMDLFREILLEVEKARPGYPWRSRELLGHLPAEVAAHVKMIEDAGLIEASFASGGRAAMIQRITNSGYDFLKASRQRSLWQKAKAKLTAAGTPITVYAIKPVLDALIKSHLPHS